MSAPPPVGETNAERYARLLSGFAERCGRMSADIEDRFQATEDPMVAATLAQAMHAIGRSLRQTIALALRLEREAATIHRQALDEAKAERAEQITQRSARVRSAVEQLLWTEYEGVDCEEDLDGLDTRALIRNLIHEAAEDPGFLDGPVEPIIEHLQASLRHILDSCLGEAPPSSPAGGGGPQDQKGSAQIAPPQYAAADTS